MLAVIIREMVIDSRREKAKISNYVIVSGVRLYDAIQWLLIELSSAVGLVIA